MLATVPDKYLVGLDCVLMRNEESLSRRERRGKVWSRGRKVEKGKALGFYHHGGSRANQPFIELRVDKIVAGMGKGVWFPFLRSVVLGYVLFHELGHHIHDTVRPEYDEKEDVADNWSRKLNANFLRKRYWYAIPLMVPAAKVYIFLKRRLRLADS